MLPTFTDSLINTDVIKSEYFEIIVVISKSLNLMHLKKQYLNLDLF